MRLDMLLRYRDSLRRFGLALPRTGKRAAKSGAMNEWRIDNALRLLTKAQKRDAALVAEQVQDRARRDPVVLGERVLTRQQQWRRAFHGILARDFVE